MLICIRMAIKSLGVDVVMKYLDHDKLHELVAEFDKHTYRYFIIRWNEPRLFDQMYNMKKLVAFSANEILEGLANDAKIITSLAFERYMDDDQCDHPYHECENFCSWNFKREFNSKVLGQLHDDDKPTTAAGFEAFANVVRGVIPHNRILNYIKMALLDHIWLYNNNFETMYVAIEDNELILTKFESDVKLQYYRDE